jgi:hypothetical protein
MSKEKKFKKAIENLSTQLREEAKDTVWQEIKYVQVIAVATIYTLLVCFAMWWFCHNTVLISLQGKEVIALKWVVCGAFLFGILFFTLPSAPRFIVCLLPIRNTPKRIERIDREFQELVKKKIEENPGSIESWKDTILDIRAEIDKIADEGEEKIEKINETIKKIEEELPLLEYIKKNFPILEW